MLNWQFGTYKAPNWFYVVQIIGDLCMVMELLIYDNMTIVSKKVE